MMSEISKVTVILRGYDYNQTRNVMKALLQTSIRAVEITLNSSGALRDNKRNI